MPQNIGSASIGVSLDLRNASRQFAAFQRQLNTSGRNSNLFSSISADAKDFENSLGKATNRVVAFASAAAVFGTLAKTAQAFAQSIVEVDNSLAKINVNLGQSAESLKAFGAQVFNVARQTGQTFEVAAKAAEELARQGLGAEDTIDRLQKALVLSRIAGIDSAEAVNTLTAAINSFNESALTAGEIVNKFAAVDTKFAVSSKDLAEAVSRVGSTAQSAGVGIDQLIGLVTSLQQTTARGGATIGNGLKTIFTRIQSAPETINALESVGVAIKNTDGSLRDAISILRDYSAARDKVGEVERQGLDRTVAGTFQINILKAALADLGKEYSVYGSAVKTASGATDEAIRKNEVLNQTLSSLINSTTVSIKQFFASVGGQDIGPILNTLLKSFERARAFFSGDSGSDLGKSLGEGLIKGISAVITGPTLGALILVLSAAFKKVIVTIAQEARTLLQINSAVAARANAQKEINTLLTQANASERQSLALATNTLQQYEALLAVKARLNQESLIGTPLSRLAVRKGGFVGKPGYPGFADPIKSAMTRESAASGLPSNQIYIDRDARVATFANPMGLLVANSRDEPLGGYQGVDRVLSQGGNPKTNGIPGFAATRRNPFNSDAAETEQIIKSLNQESKNFGTSLKSLNFELRSAAKRVYSSDPGFLIRPALPPYRRLNNVNSNQYSSPVGPKTPFANFRVNMSTGGVRTQDEYEAAGGYQGQLEREGLGQYGGRSSTIPISSRGRVLGAQELRRRQLARNEAAAARQQKIQNRTLAASFALPLIGGFAEPAIQGLGFSTKGGTGGGVAAGALSYGLSGAGVGGLFGLPGLAIGGGIGVLVGAFSKLKKSVEEITSELDEQIEVRGKETDTLVRAVQAQEQLNEARKDGADKSTLDKLEAAFREARSGLTNPASRSILGISDSKLQTKALTGRQEELAREESQLRVKQLLLNPNVVNQFQKGGVSGSRGNEALANEIGRSLSDADFSSISDDFVAALSKSATTNFNVRPDVGYTPRGDTFVKNEGEIASATEAFNNAVKLITPLASKLNLSGSDLNKQNLQGTLLGILQSIGNNRTNRQQNTEDDKKKFNGLGIGSFLSPLNGDIAVSAALTGRSPTANRGARSQSSFDFYNELQGTGGIGKEVLESLPGYQQSRAGVQSKNLTDFIIKFLTSNNPSLKEGNLRDSRGNANLTSIERVLSQVSGGGTSAAGKASDLLALIPKLRETLATNKISTTGYIEGVSGYIPGAGYNTKGKPGGPGYINSSNVTGHSSRFGLQNISNDLYNDTPVFNVAGKPFVTKSQIEAQNSKIPTSAAQINASNPNADIESYLKIASDAKTAAETALAALQQTLNIIVTVNGAGDPDTLAAIQKSIQDLYNTQASTSGKPNPPTPPSITPDPMKALRRVGQSMGLPVAP